MEKTVSDDFDPDDRGGGQRPPRLRNLARRIFREVDPESFRDGLGAESQSEVPEGEHRDPGPARGSGRGERNRGDPWALLGALLETGDKAKTEMVRMLAREVRTYLEALELHKDLHHLLTNYSLEVNASFSLKPLADAVPPPSERSESTQPAEPLASPEPSPSSAEDDTPSRS